MESCLKMILCLLAAQPLVQGNQLESTNGSNICGNWITYTKEKCLKLLNTDDLHTEVDAEKSCRSLPRSQSFSRIITVKTREEQNFLLKFLYENEISESIWLGLRKTNNSQQLEWNDGSNLNFSNLLKQNLTADQNQCVEMNVTGEWTVVSCNKKNFVVCEGEPSRPTETLVIEKPSTNPTELGLVKSKQSGKDCEEEILISERKNDLLNEATDKITALLAAARQQIKDLEQITELNHSIIHHHDASIQDGSRILKKTLCGDWTAYKDEKCFKFADKAGHQTMEDAETVCQAFSQEVITDLEPKLITIKSKEEQEFLEDFLFINNKMVDNVWIGLSRKDSNSTFKWRDGCELSFSNWANQVFPEEHHACVQVESGDGSVATGLWLRVSCNRKNAVVCERRPTWSLELLQDALLNYRFEQELKQKESYEKLETLEEEQAKKDREWEEKFEKSQEKHVAEQRKWEQKFAKYEEEQDRKTRECEHKFENAKEDYRTNQKVWEQKFAKLDKDHVAKHNGWEQKFMNNEEKQDTTQREWERKFKESQSKIISLEGKNQVFSQEISTLMKMKVPAGFIYVQLFGQLVPQTIWPNNRWEDVSNSYAGLFFRVVGGKAAPFGQVQEESSSRLAGIERISGRYPDAITVPASGWSGYVDSGGASGYLRGHGMRFGLSSSESRPRNQALKIWKAIS